MSGSTVLTGVEETLDFDAMYEAAAGDPSRIPWADERPNPALVNWLNAVAPSLVRCGGRVAIVGCGLGHDAREVMRRGYDVVAFDISPTAIAWAQRLDPEHAESYVAADLFNSPSRWRHRFDLVVDVYTVQSLPPSQHTGAIAELGHLVARHGHLLMIARAIDEHAPDAEGPPWPLRESAVRSATTDAGLAVDRIDVFPDDESPPKLRLRGLFRRM